MRPTAGRPAVGRIQTWPSTLESPAVGKLSTVCAVASSEPSNPGVAASVTPGCTRHATALPSLPPPVDVHRYDRENERPPPNSYAAVVDFHNMYYQCIVERLLLFVFCTIIRRVAAIAFRFLIFISAICNAFYCLLFVRFCPNVCRCVQLSEIICNDHEKQTLNHPSPLTFIQITRR